MKKEEKIIAEIFDEPEKWKHIRKIARKCNVSPNSVRSYVAKQKDILELKNEGNMVLCRANMENETYLSKKRIYNLSKIYESGLINYLYDIYTPKVIVLFGSYSRGEDTSVSDVDIGIVTGQKKRPDLTKYEKFLHRHIELSLFTYKDISLEFFNNLINGIVIRGFLKYEKF